jgi:hypothetical protein
MAKCTKKEILANNFMFYKKKIWAHPYGSGFLLLLPHFLQGHTTLLASLFVYWLGPAKSGGGNRFNPLRSCRIQNFKTIQRHGLVAMFLKKNFEKCLHLKIN